MNVVVNRDQLEKQLLQAKFHQFLGLELLEVTEEHLKLKLPLNELFVTEGDYIHGGILATIIDIAGYFEVQKQFPQPAPTVHLTIDYLRAAKREDLYVTAKTIKLGRSVSVVDVTVTNEVNKMIAIGRGLFNTKQ